MTHDVETPPPDAPSLADASSGWLATVAIGVVVFMIAAGAWAVLTLLDEPLRDSLLGVMRNDAADVALGVASLHDTATLLAVLGLVLLTRVDPTPGLATRRRGRWLALAIASLVLVCVGDHVIGATRSVWAKSITLGPADDATWRAVAVDGRHLAWSIAIALLLAVANDVARRDRPATKMLAPPFAWPLTASLVVFMASRDAATGNASWSEPRFGAVGLEIILAVLTILSVTSSEFRLIRAWRTSRRRVASPRAAEDVCLRCEYDLRGIADDAACPECGLLAGRSRTTAAAHLRDAPPAWLRGIAVGVVLVLLAEVLGATWPFVADALVTPNVSFANGVPSVFGVGVDPIVVVGVPPLLCAAMLFAGVWLLSRPQRGHDAHDRMLRGTLRAFAVVPAVAIALIVWNFRASAASRWPSVATQFVAVGLLTIGCAPLPALMFALLRRLARRVLNANLAEHATIVGVGLALTLIAIPLVAIGLSLGESFGRGRSNAPLYWLLAILVSFVLFAGWSAVNCIRFALAFRRAGREARALWRDADFGIDDLARRPGRLDPSPVD